MIAIVVAAVAASVVKTQIYDRGQDHDNQGQQRSDTTLARLDFEEAEQELAKARLVMNIVQNNETPREAVVQKAQERVDTAAEEWIRSLKQVLQMRRRNRYPSPQTKAIYDRFRPKINTVESN
jgi:hypothetical protein